jgi:hypothetical protein
MTLFLWSKTAATNANADPNVDWHEGQSPPSVNNSARAMMAAVADWNADFSIGVTFTEGGGGGFGLRSGEIAPLTLTGTPYAGTSDQDFSQHATITSLSDHQLFGVVPQIDSPDSAALTIDGIGPLAMVNASGNAIIEGQLQAFVPYLFRYKAADSSLYLENAPEDLDQSVPVGAILLFAGNVLPSDNFAWCNGQALDQGTYSTLFALIGSTYGGGGGGGGGLGVSGRDAFIGDTFNIPNLTAMTIIGERTASGSIPQATSLHTATGSATVNGTVIGWTIVIPYIMRII